MAQNKWNYLYGFSLWLSIGLVFLYGSALQVKAAIRELKVAPDDIVNEVLYEKYEYDEDLRPVRSLGEYIKYQYPSKKSLKGNIISGNTELIAPNKYRVYAGQVYDLQPDGWYELEYDEMPRDDYIDATTPNIVFNWIKKAYASTFYPSSDDGITIGGTSWSTIHSASAGDSLRGGTTMYIQSRRSGSDRNIDVMFLVFDTSSITSSYEVTAADLVLTGNAKQATDALEIKLGIYDSTSSDTIVTDDYDQRGTSLLSDTYITSTAWNSSGTNTFSFNSTGLAYINVDGLTKISGREANYDVPNIEPTVDSGRYLGAATVETTGTASDPYLDITVTEVTEEIVVINSHIAEPIYATSTCEAVDASTTECTYEVSALVKNIAFILYIMLGIMFMFPIGFIFSNLTDKDSKSWL